VFENTRALGLSEGSPCTVKTDRGDLVADRVVVASHFPFLDRSLAFARMHPERSYALGLRIRGEPPPGMFISADSPTRSIRAHPRDGGELLIVGGEGHKVGQGGDTRERYRRLEAFAREHFDVEAVEYRWSSQDNMTADGVPYVGALTPLSKRVLYATGFAKWGLTNGVAAALMLADRLLERDNPWAETFDANRLKPLAQAKDLVKENVDVAMRFFGDRMRPPGVRSLAELRPDEGAIVSHEGRKLAAYRDEEGRVSAVSPVCTHLWCQVKWNAAERSWDCPCHGSRFDTQGQVLQGPAVEGLEPRPLDPDL
jgi:Rieske Fe-S protein